MSSAGVAWAALFALVASPFGLTARAQTPEPRAYTPPATIDGAPDLQGIWQVLNTAHWDVQDHNASLGVPGGLGVVEGGDIPYQPWALAKKRENAAHREPVNPEAKCYLPGVPHITYMPFPFEIHQFPRFTIIAYEFIHADRIIYTDGSPHPEGHLDWWMGDSRGHWERNTLVVDVTDFNDKTRFDLAGNFHSDALHLTERYTRTGPDHMSYEVTIEDPKVFTRPWTMRMPLYRRQEPRLQLLEYECYAYLDEENDKTGKFPK